MSRLCLCDACHEQRANAFSRRKQRTAALIVCSLLALAIACVITFAQ